MSRTTNQTTRRVTGIIARETDKAILIRITKIDEQLIDPDRGEHYSVAQWIPRSQIPRMRIRADEPSEFQIKEWILDKNGLLENIKTGGNVIKSEKQDDPPLNTIGNDDVPYRGTDGFRYREDDDDDIPF